MKDRLRSLAAACLLFFTGALFVAATSSPTIDCNMTLKILGNGDHLWECYGQCPPGDACSLLEVSGSGGTIMMCWCPASETTSQCPGSLWIMEDGTIVVRCLLDDMRCHIANSGECVTELSYNSEYYRPICKCKL